MHEFILNLEQHAALAFRVSRRIGEVVVLDTYCIGYDCACHGLT